MKTITIQISVPDDVEFRIISGAIPDDFENEPLPDEARFGPEAPVVPQNAAPAPAPHPVAVMAAPAPLAPPARIWNEGDVHQQGHKPLRRNARGLFCPTSIGKDATGKTAFCPWPQTA